jgi:hypothetical protein
MPGPRAGFRKPQVSFGARISVEADQIRRELEQKLNVPASKLLELALAALAREVHAPPAE